MYTTLPPARRALTTRMVRATVALTAAFVTIGVLSVPAANADGSTPAPLPSPTATPSPTTTPTPTPTPVPTPEPTPTPKAKPFKKMKMGERSNRVRKLESRLHQLGLHSEVITWTFDTETHNGVVAFQAKYGVKGRRGVVGKQTWTKLVSLTKEPTKNALKNVYTPGKPLMRTGSKGKKVRRLEARLKQLRHFKGKVGPTYDRKTRLAVRRFQKAVKIPVNGKVDARTRDRLGAITRTPNRTEMYNLSVKGAKLDERCKTGRVLCIDKTSRTVRWVVSGVVKTRLDARFGGASYPTREGQFSVFRKSRDHVSSIYGSSMPFAMFFSGGQAVHYSPDFAQTGYNGASHGCVNIRDRAAIQRLFDKVRIGDKVVVYRS